MGPYKVSSYHKKRYLTFSEKLKRLLDSIVSLEDIFDRARIPILLIYDFSVLIISFSLIFENRFLGHLLSKDKLFN